MATEQQYITATTGLADRIYMRDTQSQPLREATASERRRRTPSRRGAATPVSESSYSHQDTHPTGLVTVAQGGLTDTHARGAASRALTHAPASPHALALHARTSISITGTTHLHTHSLTAHSLTHSLTCNQHYPSHAPSNESAVNTHPKPCLARGAPSQACMARVTAYHYAGTRSPALSGTTA